MTPDRVSVPASIPRPPPPVIYAGEFGRAGGDHQPAAAALLDRAGAGQRSDEREAGVARVSKVAPLATVTPLELAIAPPARASVPALIAVAPV